MTTAEDLQEFLTSRRANVQPEQVGFPNAHGRRRVRGLRREEVAERAGISTDYYIRLERGRVRGISDEVLGAVARALLLSPAEHTHLLNLVAAATRVRVPAQRQPRAVRPSLLRLLDSMETVPAMIQGPRTDVLAMNRLGAALYPGLGTTEPGGRNLARFVYLDERAPDFYDDWTQSARDCVAMLRLASGRTPDDRLMNELIGELSVQSEHFRALWAEHDVRDHRSGTKILHHPMVGELAVTYESLDVGDSDQRLVSYTVAPGSPSAGALALLASWNAPVRDVETTGADSESRRER